MAAAGQIQYALFKNGVEVPNSRFEVVDPNVALQAANAGAEYTSYFQLKGQATIDITSATDSLELRLVSSDPTILQGTDNTVVVASMNVEKVSV